MIAVAVKILITLAIFAAIGAGVALRDADGSDDAVHGHGVLVQVEDGPDPSHGWGDAPELTDAAHAVDEALDMWHPHGPAVCERRGRGLRGFRFYSDHPYRRL